MPEYRFYTIEKSGHVRQLPLAHELPSDQAANEKAKKLIDGHDIEIWQGARMVAYLVSDEKVG
jgi:hypothetical protein